MPASEPASRVNSCQQASAAPASTATSAAIRQRPPPLTDRSLRPVGVVASTPSASIAAGSSPATMVGSHCQAPMSKGTRRVAARCPSNAAGIPASSPQPAAQTRSCRGEAPRDRVMTSVARYRCSTIRTATSINATATPTGPATTTATSEAVVHCCFTIPSSTSVSPVSNRASWRFRAGSSAPAGTTSRTSDWKPTSWVRSSGSETRPAASDAASRGYQTKKPTRVPLSAATFNRSPGAMKAATAAAVPLLGSTSCSSWRLGSNRQRGAAGSAMRTVPTRAMPSPSASPARLPIRAATSSGSTTSTFPVCGDTPGCGQRPETNSNWLVISGLAVRVTRTW